MIRMVCCVVMLWSAGGAVFATPTAEVIARHSYERLQGLQLRQALSKKTDGVMAVLINEQPGRAASVNAFESYVNNDFADGVTQSKALVVFRSGKQRGVGVLMTRYLDPARSPRLQIWLPALRKVRRFSSPAHNDYWAGSVLTYGELFLRRPSHEDHELLGKAQFADCLTSLSLPPDAHTAGLQLPEASCLPKGRPVYRLKSTSHFERWWYDYRLTWIDAETFAPYRTDYFKSGKRVKRVEMDWRRYDDADPQALYPRYVHARDLQTGRASLVFIPRKTLRWNTRLPASFWSERTLRKIKR